MNQIRVGPHSWKVRLYQALKYSCYALLTVNIYFFLNQELTAAFMSTNGHWSLGSIVQLFSATLDTTAWVILLLLFELETAILSDDKLVGWTKRVIHGVRLICGLAICSAFVGYLGEWSVLESATPLSQGLACELLGQGYSVMLGFDDFATLTEANCGRLIGDLVSVDGFDSVIATQSTLRDAQWLALTDVINAGAWILVVVVLELEVRMQLHGGVPDRFQVAMTASKFAIYSALAGAAVYWGLAGDFLDFWDAALWLFAFVFIELNVFEWQQELAQEHSST